MAPNEVERMTQDTRIVSGARCTWWDSIDKAGKTSSGLPGCPHCGSPLFETSSIEAWNKGVQEYEAAGHPGYAKRIAWMRGKCYRNLDEANKAYENELFDKFQPRG